MCTIRSKCIRLSVLRWRETWPGSSPAATEKHAAILKEPKVVRLALLFVWVANTFASSQKFHAAVQRTLNERSCDIVQIKEQHGILDQESSHDLQRIFDMTTKLVFPDRQGYDKEVALVLQGGGALGSYQAGVYEALASSPYQPKWVAGISIGSINAAIIAGNAPADRVARLRQFWEEITASSPLWPMAQMISDGQHKLGAIGSILFGQPGFFAPRAMLDWLREPKPTSYYDTSALRSTLERLVDFDRINSGEIRFSVGAVNVRTGRFAYFDNQDTVILPEHIMASGALPPGFPAVEIDGEFYWDGGLVSNTPLQQILDIEPRRSRLTFQVDVFQSYGELPSTFDEVAEREKDIRFASRTRAATEAFEAMHNVRSNAHELWNALPDEVKSLPQAEFLKDLGCATEMDIVQLIYRPFEPQGAMKDIEFSRETMENRWEQGRRDAQVTLLSAPWLAPCAPGVGARVFDVLHDAYVAQLSGTERPKVGDLAE